MKKLFNNIFYHLSEYGGAYIFFILLIVAIFLAGSIFLPSKTNIERNYGKKYIKDSTSGDVKLYNNGECAICHTRYRLAATPTQFTYIYECENGHAIKVHSLMNNNQQK